MNTKKEVIYIDIDDEITGIISKLKSSKAKIIAFVPPKRSNVFASVVNLKLLKRAADDNKKQFVLITNEKALVALAGGLDIYVAKNLHSKPAVPDAEGAPEVDDSVIEGKELSLADSASEKSEKAESKEGDSIDLSDLNMDEKKPEATDKKKKGKKVGAIKSSKIKVPNFEAFRLKAILGFVGVFGLIGLWFWAFKIAPNATINITAQTSRIDTVKEYVVNGNAEASDFENNLIKPQVQTIKRSVSEQFTATGEKDVGNKATGTMTIQNCGSSLSTEIAAGTVFSSPGGLEFETNETIVFPGGVFTPTCTSPGEADVIVTALEAGDTYNLAAAAYTASGTGVSGFGGQMSGGTSEKVTVVDTKDFNAAKEALRERAFDDVKEELRGAFAGEVVVIDESFQAKEGKFTSDPKVGEEANKATATVEMTFVMMAVDRSELAQAIDDSVNARISADQQSIYENGIDNVNFELKSIGNNLRIDVVMRAHTIIGPEINEESISNEVAGKAFSEARAIIEGRAGVRSVDIDFSPFWVSNAPSANKIEVSVEFAESSLQ